MADSDANRYDSETSGESVEVVKSNGRERGRKKPRSDPPYENLMSIFEDHDVFHLPLARPGENTDNWVYTAEMWMTLDSRLSYIMANADEVALGAYKLEINSLLGPDYRRYIVTPLPMSINLENNRENSRHSVLYMLLRIKSIKTHVFEVMMEYVMRDLENLAQLNDMTKNLLFNAIYQLKNSTFIDDDCSIYPKLVELTKNIDYIELEVVLIDLVTHIAPVDFHWDVARVMIDLIEVKKKHRFISQVYLNLQRLELEKYMIILTTNKSLAFMQDIVNQNGHLGIILNYYLSFVEYSDFSNIYAKLSENLIIDTSRYNTQDNLNMSLSMYHTISFFLKRISRMSIYIVKSLKSYLSNNPEETSDSVSKDSQDSISFSAKFDNSNQHPATHEYNENITLVLLYSLVFNQNPKVINVLKTLSPYYAKRIIDAINSDDENILRLPIMMNCFSFILILRNLSCQSCVNFTTCKFYIYDLIRSIFLLLYANINPSLSPTDFNLLVDYWLYLLRLKPKNIMKEKFVDFISDMIVFSDKTILFYRNMLKTCENLDYLEKNHLKILFENMTQLLLFRDEPANWKILYDYFNNTIKYVHTHKVMKIIYTIFVVIKTIISFQDESNVYFDPIWYTRFLNLMNNNINDRLSLSICFFGYFSDFLNDMMDNTIPKVVLDWMVDNYVKVNFLSTECDESNYVENILFSSNDNAKHPLCLTIYNSTDYFVESSVDNIFITHNICLATKFKFFLSMKKCFSFQKIKCTKNFDFDGIIVRAHSDNEEFDSISGFPDKYNEKLLSIENMVFLSNIYVELINYFHEMDNVESIQVLINKFNFLEKRWLCLWGNYNNKITFIEGHHKFMNGCYISLPKITSIQHMFLEMENSQDTSIVNPNTCTTLSLTKNCDAKVSIVDYIKFFDSIKLIYKPLNVDCINYILKRMNNIYNAEMMVLRSLLVEVDESMFNDIDKVKKVFTYFVGIGDSYMKKEPLLDTQKKIYVIFNFLKQFIYNCDMHELSSFELLRDSTSFGNETFFKKIEAWHEKCEIFVVYKFLQIIKHVFTAKCNKLLLNECDKSMLENLLKKMCLNILTDKQLLISSKGSIKSTLLYDVVDNVIDTYADLTANDSKSAFEAISKAVATEYVQSEECKSFPLINAYTFPIVYAKILKIAKKKIKTICTKAQDDMFAKLLVVVDIFHTFMEICKVLCQTDIILMALRHGYEITSVFVITVLPIIGNNIIDNYENCFILLKAFQKGTRTLHTICNHSKVHESQRTYRYVPLAKQTLEKLVQGVKKILLNKDLENSISIGNLKNYNIHGDVIQTQNFISPINTISELSTAYELLSQRDTSNVNVTHENQNPIYDNDDVCSEISTPEILSDASVVSESF